MTRLRQKKSSKRATRPWTDTELLVALEAYLFAFRLELAGAEYSENELANVLLGGPLRSRNQGSIRYRMRNISFVLQSRGLRFNKNYSPATQVGAGVYARLSAILDSLDAVNTSFLRDVDKKTSPSPLQTGGKAILDTLTRFEELERALRDLETEFVGIGHNQPPEQLEAEPLTATDIRRAADDAREIKQELVRSDVNSVAIRSPQARLTGFGLKLAVWLGGRFTKFADAAAVALGSIAVAKATHVLPMIIDAVQMLARVIGH